MAFLMPLLARRGREQRAFAGDRAGDIGAGTGQRLHGLGLGAARPGHDQQPQRIAGQALRCRGGNRGGGGVEVVFRAEPFFENAVHVRQGPPRIRWRPVLVRRFLFLLVAQILVRVFHAGIDTGSQRCGDRIRTVVRDIAVCRHGLGQRGLDLGALDPAARDHAAEPVGNGIQRLIALAWRGCGQLGAAAFQCGERVTALADAAGSGSLTAVRLAVFFAFAPGSDRPRPAARAGSIRP